MKISSKELTELTTFYSKPYKINPKIIQAIIQVESNYNKDACRFESSWSYFYEVKYFAKRLNITQDTERVMQATSWGLCQIIGTVARENSFKQELHLLSKPSVNIELCTKKLHDLISKYGGIQDAVAAYNAGYPKKNGLGEYMNQAYVDKVFTAYDSFY